MAVKYTPLALYGYGFFMLAAVAMMSVSLGTAYWKTTEFQGQATGHYGLFKQCNMQKCYSFSDVPEFVESVRALCLTALSLFVITLLIIGHLVLVRKLQVQSKTHGWVTMWICLIASIFACAGPAHYLVKTGMSNWFADNTWDFGYSLFFSFGSSFLSFWAGIFSILAVSSLYRAQHPLPAMQPFVYPASTMHVAGPVTYIPPSMQQYPGNLGYPNQGFVQNQQAFQNTAQAADGQKQLQTDKQ